ncbi:hypothetical protein BCR33DRAFT_717020 [Rhizoclosmatium globosum]|uniref:Uncharacterized protein n=1 Tax=Rhizoclosmatium globosum TaxID=329046 RepID=A0A1Y2CBW5_9FUNG|nr:hypothetical protein BCR33DRAFT_717020 [Rhizoclosmatium globosum]|eukprot:ORY44523.1 hypothetical protein BCR33DRAFT_717020 [Rhizoclosmatium globosum]
MGQTRPEEYSSDPSQHCESQMPSLTRELGSDTKPPIPRHQKTPFGQAEVPGSSEPSVQSQ